MAAILEVENLSKNYKDFSLKGVNITLERGYIMGFIGPNGAGKSTTIKLIMNLLRRDSGSVRVFGLDNAPHEREIKDRIGFVYDENVFYEELTVEQMKGVIAPFYSRWDEAAFARRMRDFDLPPRMKIKELSKGMKMKFSLAVSLSHHAELLIMDEPTSGLDPLIRSDLLEVLSTEMQDECKSVFFSTHITADLDKVADYVTLINQGKILFSSTKDEIVENYALVKGPKALLDEKSKNSFVGIRENQFGFEGLARSRSEARKLFGDRVLFEKPTLEDVMLYFTRRERNA